MRKMMRISLLILISILTVVGVSAQEKKTTFGVKAGMNVSNLTGDVEGADAKIGFNVGVTLDYELAANMYLLSGLEFNSKGVKGSEGGAKVTMNLLYLQLPVHFGYKLDVADNTKILFHAGPYIAYGVGGKTSVTVPGVGKEKVNSFSSGVFKEFDFGLGLGVGAEFGKIGVGLGYDFGLINILDAPGKVKNANFYVSVGYKF